MRRLLHNALLPEAPGAIRYAATASLFILFQHVFVALAILGAGARLKFDNQFLLFPIRELATLAGVSPAVAIAGFAFGLLISTMLVILSLRRAAYLGRGDGLALVTMIPTLQILAAVALTILWRRRHPPESQPEPEIGSTAIPSYRTAIGVLSGMALIVLAVAVSTLTFGSYGWGLFVMTPFLVGVTTGYIVNRGRLHSGSDTFLAVAMAGILGTAALLMLALEGFMCIVLIAPLAIILAGFGGAIGRAAAKQFHPRQPLYSVAILPLLFLLDAAMPPELPITTRTSIIISASPDAIWNSLTADRPVTEAPGLVGMAGLAYPVASRISGEGAGARRVGVFSTGTADERVTIWKPGRTLAFRVVRQPPAMEEMSPYRQLHTPHLVGYFDTDETRFDLVPLADGRTRLIATADHVLRIDPVIYWAPIARWAIGRNVARVLTDVKKDSERGTKLARQAAPLSAHSPHGHTLAQLAR